MVMGFKKTKRFYWFLLLAPTGIKLKNQLLCNKAHGVCCCYIDSIIFSRAYLHFEVAAQKTRFWK